MGSRVIIGIDNGATGTIALVGLFNPIFMETPVKKGQDYTVKVQNVSRIDWARLKELLEDWKSKADEQETPIFAYVERPYTGRFPKTVAIAARAYEATIIILEQLGIGYEAVDSGHWQKGMLPKGTKTSVKLKKASRDVGCRLFPMHAELIKKHTDADGLLIAEYYRREHG